MSAAARHLAPLDEIVAGLADHAEAMAASLLPQGHRERDEWVVDGRDSPFGCSLGVHLRAPRKGVWKAWASGLAGDALDLVAQVRFHGDKSQAVRWALDWLGRNAPIEPEHIRQARREKAQQNAADDERARGRAAFRIWLAAKPSLAGTPAAAYLAGRGIDLAQLGRQPSALRYHPQLWDEVTRRHWPALVAGVFRAGKLVAVHRTWLEERPDGRVGKAPIVDAAGKSQAKRSYGPKRGGVIPLWRGASGRPFTDPMPGEALILSEGIEDGLSFPLAAPQYRVAAAVDLGNMALIDLPAAIATVLIATQNDPWWHEAAGRMHGAAQGLDNATRHFQAQGRDVRWIRPPSGKDINDTLRGVG